MKKSQTTGQYVLRHLHIDIAKGVMLLMTLAAVVSGINEIYTEALPYVGDVMAMLVATVAGGIVSTTAVMAVIPTAFYGCSSHRWLAAVVMVLAAVAVVFSAAAFTGMRVLAPPIIGAEGACVMALAVSVIAGPLAAIVLITKVIIAADPPP